MQEDGKVKERSIRNEEHIKSLQRQVDLLRGDVKSQSDLANTNVGLAKESIALFREHTKLSAHSGVGKDVARLQVEVKNIKAWLYGGAGGAVTAVGLTTTVLAKVMGWI